MRFAAAARATVNSRMSTPRPTITIDTNCAINIFDGSSTTATSVAELQTLFRYALSGPH